MGDYSDYKPTQLKKVELTEELKQFTASLINVLKNEAQMNLDAQSDRVRLKAYFKDPKNPGQFIEMGALKDWNYGTHSDGTFNFSGESDFETTDKIDTVENEISQNCFELENALYYMERGTITQDYLQHIMALKSLADKGMLFVTKPGEKIKDSHPIVIENGNTVKMLPSIKDCPPEDLGKEPYLSADQKLQSSPNYDNQEYADRLVQESHKLSTFNLKGGTHATEKIISDLVSEAGKKGISKTEYLNALANINIPTDVDLAKLYKTAAENDEFKPDIKINTFSSREQRERAQLSARALQEYAASMYDFMTVTYPLRDAAKAGEFTLDELDVANSSRDIFALLLDFGDEEAAKQNNINAVKAMVGKGLDQNDPNYAVNKSKMFAGYVNQRLKQISEFDYDKYTNLDDKEFVEKYKELSTAFYRVRIMKGELSTLRQNPYLNPAYIEQCNKIVEKYSDYDYYFQHRMRAILNPYYSKVDTSQLENLSNRDYFDMGLDNLSKDRTFTRLAQEISGVRNVKPLLHSSIIAQKMIDGGTLGKEANITFFDSQGQEVFNIPELVSKGEIIFAADKLNPNSVSAFQIDKNTLAVSEVQLTKNMQATIDAIKANVNERIRNTCMTLENYLGNNRDSKLEGIVTVCLEVNKKGLNRNKVFQQLRDFYDSSKTDTFTQNELYHIFEEKGMTPRHLSADEVNRRRERTLAAHKANFDFTMDRIESSAVSNADKIQGVAKRIFEHTLFKYEAGNKEYNESVIDRFFSDDPNARKAVVTEAAERFLANEELFDRDYTDDELIENWAKIRSTSIAMSMEYDSFKQMLTKFNVELPKETMDRLDNLRKKVSTNESFYIDKLNVMLGKYYKYGLEDVLDTTERGIEASYYSRDNEYSLYCQAISSKVMHENNEMGISVEKLALPEGQTMGAAFDEAGNLLDGPEEMGNALRHGHQVFVVDTQFNVYGKELEDITKIPPTFKDKAAPEGFVTPDIKLVVNNEMVDRSKISYEDALIAKQINKQKCSLEKLAANKNDPQYTDKLKETLAEYYAVLSVKKVLSAPGMDDAHKTKMRSDKVLNDFKTGLLNSPLLEELMENQLPNSPEEIMNMDLDQMYSKLNAAQKVVGQRQLEAKKALAARREEPAYLENLVIEGDRKTNPENFFKTITSNTLEELRAATPLKSMTLTRTSLQTLTLSMMLVQGYSVEQAMAPNARDDREFVAQGAMKCIKAGDYKTIIENLTKGLVKYNKYVNEKLMALEPLSISSIADPKNATLLAVLPIIKDFSQEIDNAQKHIPKEQRIKSPVIDEQCWKAEVLGNITQNILGGLFAGDTTLSLTDMTSRYLKSECMRKHVMDQRALPENKGKNLYDLLSPEALTEFNEMNALNIANVGTDNLPKTKQGQEELIKLIKTDKLRTKMDTKIVNGEEGKEFQFDLDGISNALDQKAVQKQV